MNIFQFLRILWARRWVTFSAIVFTFLGAFIAILIVPPRYEATSRVMLNILKPDPVTGMMIGGPAARTYIATQTELIRDYGVAESVVERLQWDTNPGVISQYQASGNTDVDIQRWLASRIVQATSTRVVPGTNILEISYKATTPGEAKTMADAVRDAYITSSLEERRLEATRTAQWYEAQAERERNLLNQADAAKTAFEKESGIVMQGDLDLDTARLRALSSQAAVPSAMMAPLPSSAAPSSAQLAQLDAAIANASKTLGPNHPQMAQLRAQRATVAQIVQQEMTASRSAAAAVASAASASASALQREVQSQATKVIQNRDKIERLNQLQAEVNQRRELYNKSLARIAELRQEALVADSGITTLSEAATPRKASFPNKPLILGGGLGLGAGMGVLLSLLLELLQRRVRSSEDLQAAVDAPVLGVVRGMAPELPRAPFLQRALGMDLSLFRKRKIAARARGNRMTVQIASATIEERSSRGFAFSPDLFMVSDPGGERSETIRGMRTHLLTQHIGEGRRGLAICAASGDVWTMTIGANLGASFAQVGLSCLLVDADLRTPTLHQIIKASEPCAGLADCLSNGVAAEQIIQHDVLPNLDVIFSAGPRADAQELLGGEVFGKLARNWLRDYDITVINTPAANKYADGRRISAIIGYSVVVARQNVSYISDLKHLVGQLNGDGVKIVGTILSYE